MTVSHHRTNVQMKEARRNLREDLGKTKAWVAGNRNTIVKVLAVEAVIVGANVGWAIAAGRSPTWSKFKVGDRIKETVKTIKVVNRFTKPFECRCGSSARRSGRCDGGASAGEACWRAWLRWIGC